jgi:hypothetical protein
MEEDLKSEEEEEEEEEESATSWSLVGGTRGRGGEGDVRGIVVGGPRGSGIMVVRGEEEE